MNKKLLYFAAITIVAILFISSANASLNVSVNVADPSIGPFQPQHITATANERGIGVLIVIQPAVGDTWEQFLNAHTDLKNVWNLLSDSVQNQIEDDIGGKIVSYAIVGPWGLNGYSDVFTFPDEFHGINGQPSTGLVGTYKVLFAYFSYQGSLCHLFECDFACGLWQVIPEVPLGTAVAILSLAGAAGAYAIYKKRRYALPLN